MQHTKHALEQVSTMKNTCETMRRSMRMRFNQCLPSQCTDDK